MCLPPGSLQLFVASGQDVGQVDNMPRIAALNKRHLRDDQKASHACSGHLLAKKGLEKTGKLFMHF